MFRFAYTFKPQVVTQEPCTFCIMNFHTVVVVFLYILYFAIVNSINQTNNYVFKTIRTNKNKKPTMNNFLVVIIHNLQGVRINKANINMEPYF